METPKSVLTYSPPPNTEWIASYFQRVPLIIFIMTENILILLFLSFLFFFLDTILHFCFPSLSFCQPLSGSSIHRYVLYCGHQGQGVILIVLSLLCSLHQLKESRPAFFFLLVRITLAFSCLDVVSDTFSGVGCLRATCWPCLVTRLSPASTSF